MMRAIFSVALCAVLVACAAQNTAPAQQRVNVPVPVQCQEPMPVRPVMPTEGLRPPVNLDTFAAAAMAEIERREGYEVELATALQVCRTPIDALMLSLP